MLWIDLNIGRKVVRFSYECFMFVEVFVGLVNRFWFGVQ